MTTDTTTTDTRTVAELRAAAEALEIAIPARVKKTDLLAMVLEAEAKDEGDATRMSAILARYKSGYQPTVTARGNKSLHNGDVLANAMAGMEPEAVARMATKLLGLEQPLWVGDGTGRYDSLNPGQVRMNSGNRVRAAVKRGDVTEDEVLAAIAKA